MELGGWIIYRPPFCLPVLLFLGKAPLSLCTLPLCRAVSKCRYSPAPRTHPSRGSLLLRGLRRPDSTSLRPSSSLPFWRVSVPCRRRRRGPLLLVGPYSGAAILGQKPKQEEGKGRRKQQQKERKRRDPKTKSAQRPLARRTERRSTRTPPGRKERRRGGGRGVSRPCPFPARHPHTPTTHRHSDTGHRRHKANSRSTLSRVTELSRGVPEGAPPDRRTSWPPYQLHRGTTRRRRGPLLLLVLLLLLLELVPATRTSLFCAPVSRPLHLQPCRTTRRRPSTWWPRQRRSWDPQSPSSGGSLGEEGTHSLGFSVESRKLES